MVGAIALVGFVARLGFLADLLSKPVLVGYLAGVAVIMIAGQLEKFSGVPIEDDNPLKAIWHFLTHLGEIHPATLLMSTAVLIFLFVGSWLFPRAPLPLGIYAGYWKDSALDKGARVFAVLGQSAPPFWVAK